MLALISFSEVHSSIAALPVVIALLGALPIGIALIGGFLGKVLNYRRSEPVQFRVARDGRSFLQVGRACHFGRKGESEASLRARVSL